MTRCCYTDSFNVSACAPPKSPMAYFASNPPVLGIFRGYLALVAQPAHSRVTSDFVFRSQAF